MSMTGLVNLVIRDDTVHAVCNVPFESKMQVSKLLELAGLISKATGVVPGDVRARIEHNGTDCKPSVPVSLLVAVAENMAEANGLPVNSASVGPDKNLTNCRLELSAPMLTQERTS